jgi:hypothetical protein
MKLPQGDGLQDEQVECARKDSGRICRHVSPKRIR